MCYVTHIQHMYNEEYDKEIEAFIIENAGNTCYIDTVLMALFYPQVTQLAEQLLKRDVDDSIIWLQECIYNNFVTNIRENKSVLYSEIELIRHLSIQNGWITGGNEVSDANILFEQQDASLYYSFLLDKFHGTMIEIQRKTLIEGQNIEEIGEIEKIPFISLVTGSTGRPIRISEMLTDWLENNHSTFKRQVGDDLIEVNGLNTYYIVNIPTLLGLSINRFKMADTRDYTDIIIEKRLSPYKHNSIIPNLHKYTFQAAICHQGESHKQGHYYAIIHDSDRYFLFDDRLQPSLVEVILKGDFINREVIDMLKRDVVFLLYRYD